LYRRLPPSLDWFIEAETDPANAPVTLWLNGGPGCSSADGLMYEQGPLHFADPYVGGDEPLDTDTPPALKLNPNRWTKLSNMIFLEAPAGVGYSYFTDSNDAFTNDDITAADNFRFLQGFFQGFSEYSSNRFFVSGESYAGGMLLLLCFCVYIFIFFVPF
jgi:serine carboxypeptidase-like clade I